MDRSRWDVPNDFATGWDQTRGVEPRPKIAGFYGRAPAPFRWARYCKPSFVFLVRTRTGVAWRFRLLSKAVRRGYESGGIEMFCHNVPVDLAAKYGGFRGARYVLSLKEWHYPLTAR